MEENKGSVAPVLLREMTLPVRINIRKDSLIGFLTGKQVICIPDLALADIPHYRLRLITPTADES